MSSIVLGRGALLRSARMLHDGDAADWEAELPESRWSDVSPGGHMSNSSRDVQGRWRRGVWVGGVWYDDVTMPSVYRLFRLNIEAWWIVRGSSSLVCRGFFTESSNTFRPAFVCFLGNVHINQKLTVAEEQERSVSNWSQTCLWLFICVFNVYQLCVCVWAGSAATLQRDDLPGFHRRRCHYELFGWFLSSLRCVLFVCNMLG